MLFAGACAPDTSAVGGAFSFDVDVSPWWEDWRGGFA